MPKKKMPEFFINAFYESKFRGNLFVIKAGGKIIEDEKALDNLLSNIRELTLIGIKVLLIYGGGRAMDEESQKRGIEVEKIDGLRVTRAEDIAVMKHVVGGDLSLNVSAAMAKNNLDGLSLNALPADWADIGLRQKTKNDKFTGCFHRVHGRPINRLFKVTNFIACACLAITEDGTVCNINADIVANELAVGIKAHKLVFLSDVDGVEINGKVANTITAEQIPGYIADGTVKDGMQVKLENCKHALDEGVRRIHLLNGLKEDALKKEIFEPVGPGTMLISEAETESYFNEVEAQKVIEAQK